MNQTHISFYLNKMKVLCSNSVVAPADLFMQSHTVARLRATENSWCSRSPLLQKGISTSVLLIILSACLGLFFSEASKFTCQLIRESQLAVVKLWRKTPSPFSSVSPGPF